MVAWVSSSVMWSLYFTQSGLWKRNRKCIGIILFISVYTSVEVDKSLKSSLNWESSPTRVSSTARCLCKEQSDQIVNPDLFHSFSHHLHLSVRPLSWSQRYQFLPQNWLSPKLTRSLSLEFRFFRDSTLQLLETPQLNEYF